MMTDRLSNRLKRVNNKFASLLLRFLKALKLTSFMQASLYDIRFLFNKGDRSIRCFNRKTSLKKTGFFSALASKLNTAFFSDRKFTCSTPGHRPRANNHK